MADVLDLTDRTFDEIAEALKGRFGSFALAAMDGGSEPRLAQDEAETLKAYCWAEGEAPVNMTINAPEAVGIGWGLAMKEP